DGGDQHDEPSGNAAGTELPKVADEVFVEDLVEGDVVYVELDGEQVKISVLGLLEAEDGIELEYQIIDDNHPDVGERASLILPEGELLRRGTETDQWPRRKPHTLSWISPIRARCVKNSSDSPSSW